MKGPARPGRPVRTEDWYFITKDSLVTCTVVVYPGEVVGVPTKIYEQLKNGNTSPIQYDKGKLILLQYSDLVPLLEKSGFARL